MGLRSRRLLLRYRLGVGRPIYVTLEFSFENVGNLKGKAGPGRPKGLQNKTTLLLKDALLLAATEAGGKEGLVGYLKMQALKNPGPFLAQLGKILPLQVTGADGGPVLIVTGVQRLTDEIQERVGDEANGVPMLTLKTNDDGAA